MYSLYFISLASLPMQLIIASVWFTAFVVAIWRMGRTGDPWWSCLAILVGWLTLPIADYPDPFVRDIHSRWGIGQQLLAAQFTSRMFWVGLACLTHVAVSHWRMPIAFKEKWLTRLNGVACGIPCIAAVSAIISGADFGWTLMRTVYIGVVWLGPWALGVCLVGSTLPQRRHGIVAAALIGIFFLLAMSETIAGPFVYASLYGVHPFQSEGAARMILHRPLLAFEDGNQYGTFVVMLAVVLAGGWFHRNRADAAESVRRGKTLAITGIALSIGMAIASQSRGALLIAMGLTTIMLLRRWKLARYVAIGSMAAILLVSALHVSGAFSVRQIVKDNPIGVAVASKLKDLGLRSFGWRLANAEDHYRQLRRHPVIGAGYANWWQESAGPVSADGRLPAETGNTELTIRTALQDAPSATGDRPWPFVVLAWGAVGGLGTFGMLALLLIPAAQAWQHGSRSRAKLDRIDCIVFVILGLQLGDLFLNSTLVPASLTLASYWHSTQTLSSRFMK